MRKLFFGLVVGAFLGSLGVVVAQTPTIFNAIRVIGTSDLRGSVLDATGNLTLGDAVDVTGKLTTAASAAVAGAGFNLPHGTAPNSPSDGDFWSTTAGFFGRANGATVGPFGSASFPLLAPDGSDAAPSYSFSDDSEAGLWMTGDSLVLSRDAANAGTGFLSLNLTASSLEGGEVTVRSTVTGINFETPTGLEEFYLSGVVRTNNLSASEAGYKGVPQNIQAGNYGLILTDASKHIYHASGAGAGDTYTIPANSSVAYPVGTVVSFINDDSNSLAIAITTDTMTLVGTTDTAPCTMTENSMATALKVTSTSWLINGTGITC